MFEIKDSCAYVKQFLTSNTTILHTTTGIANFNSQATKYKLKPSLPQFGMIFLCWSITSTRSQNSSTDVVHKSKPLIQATSTCYATEKLITTDPNLNSNKVIYNPLDCFGNKSTFRENEVMRAAVLEKALLQRADHKHTSKCRFMK